MAVYDRPPRVPPADPSAGLGFRVLRGHVPATMHILALFLLPAPRFLMQYMLSLGIPGPG